MKVLKCFLIAIGLIIPGSTANGINNTSILSTNVPVTYPEMYKNYPQLWHLDMSNQTSFEFPLDRVLLVHKKLARYFCNNCSVHSIYKPSFSMLPQLTHLELDHNNLSYIHPDAFENNPLLQKVQLVGNNLVKFNPEATINHVTYLSILNLNQNPGFNINQVQMKLPWLVYFSCKYCNTSFVDKSTMSRWQRLGHLHLPNNNIERIDQDAFKPMSRFKHLNIKGNRKLTKLNVQSKTLQHLDAEDCALEGILNTSDLPALETINVRNNQISKIHERGFQNCENIKRILLDDNQIEKIPDKLLELSLYKLEALCVDRNPLQPREILGGFLAKYSAKKLRRGCLDDESPSKQFENLPSINGVALYTNFSDAYKFEENSTADFSFQNLVYIEGDYFKYVSSISKVVMDNNSNYDFPNGYAFLQSNFITELSLADCAITAIHESAFKLLPNIKSINLKGNRIKSLHSSKVFENNPKLEHLNFAHNELEFIILNQFQELKALRSVNLNHNRLLSNQRGTPFLISFFLEKLSCHLCSFYQIDDVTLSGLIKLKELDLSHNEITIVSENAFQSTKQLQRLDLSHNHLKTFEPDVLKLDHFHTLCLAGNREFEFHSHKSHILVDNTPKLHKLETKCKETTFTIKLTELLKNRSLKTAKMIRLNEGANLVSYENEFNSGTLIFAGSINILVICTSLVFQIFI
uniref:Leucine-rich repeat-containing G-protein coupled receptor 4 n=1 Tax=Culex pipiens TaxID=7175 RepID=A0A8D8DQ52_CULPI